MPAAQSWLAAKHDIFQAMSHELRMQEPEQYQQLAGSISKLMAQYTSAKTGLRLDV
jgi:hypothetical protein